MPSIHSAVAVAVQYCFDETIGYHLGGTFNPDTDCSGFIWQCLHDCAFNVGSSRFDTTNMGNVLRSAGFTEYRYTPSFVPQHGDIFMYDEGGGVRGHAFFYAENVQGYVNGYQDWDHCDGTVGLCARAKVEASSSRGVYYPGTETPIPGDQDNGLGAHTEVWSHTYSSLISGNHVWYVYRYGGAPQPTPTLDATILLATKRKNKKRGGFRIKWM